MALLTLQTLGRRLLETRGDRGIREVAAEIGVSPATLSRVERGYMPDLETFGKICRWLQIDAGEVLGVKRRVGAPPTASVQFRKDQAIAPKTAQALAQMILATQRALMLAEATEERG